MSNPIFVETNTRIAALPGIQNCDYSAKEARAALAIQDAGVSGGGSTFANTNPVIGTSSALVLTAEPLRSSVIIQNLSANNIFVNFGAPATTTNGILIEAGRKETFTGLFAAAEINAVSDAAGSQITVFAVEV